MGQRILFDCHCHTAYSCDGNLTPENLAERARRSGLGAIAITDHNTMRGIQNVREQYSRDQFLIIPGEEITTEFGDVIGIFLNGEIRSRIFAEVADEIRDQGGISILPHPLRRKTCPPSDQLAGIDFIESINSRTSEEKNIAAGTLAHDLKKPVIAGSDAHFAWEIGNAWNAVVVPEHCGPEDLRASLLAGTFHIYGREVSPIIRRSNLVLSYILKKIGRSRCNR
jgi:predicted metal-dependent phosphoesterase TrpH